LQAKYYAQTDFSYFCLLDSFAIMKLQELTPAQMINSLLKDKKVWTQQKLAEKLGVAQSTVNRWRQNAQPEGHHRDAIRELFNDFFEGEEAPKALVPLMGYVGAGAEVMPDFEQVPDDGLDQIEIPFPLPKDMIAFMVRGDSMIPVFKDGALIVVYREQKKPLESFYGEEAAVRTSDGRRFIKTIIRGQGGVNLLSWNANPIEDVQLEWIGEIFAVLPPSAIRKIAKQGGVQGQLKLRA
jgi:phage repressor protein C with HTH and peptisase S24 domain